MKILVIGTCHMDPIIEACRLSSVQADHALLGFKPHDELDRDFADGDYDLCVVGPALRHVLEAASGSSNELSYWRLAPPEIATYMSNALAYLEVKLTQIKSRIGALPWVILSVIEPSRSYIGESFRYNKALDFKEFVHELNKGLCVIARGLGANFLDVNISLDAVGRMGAQCDVMSASTHASFIGDWDYGADFHRVVQPVKPSEYFDTGDRSLRYGKNLLERLSSLQRSLKGQQVKLIIVDLDDTIWRGVSAEADFDSTMRREGWPYGLVEALLIFKRRGGLLAICSKNDPLETPVRFSKIWGDTIQLDDFVSVKIGWGPKSESIGEILKEINVLPCNTVFLDDNPREIDEVKSTFPDIRTLGFNHYAWRSTIISDSDFWTPNITEESARKTELLKSKIARDSQNPTLSRQDWLMSLKIEQRFECINSIDSPDFPRAFELLNKTNQFNTNGKRWEMRQASELFENGGRFIVTRLFDKHADNGLVGVVILQGNMILQAVLSCRVFGLGAEINMIREACNAILIDHDVIYGSVEPTGKNFVSMDLYERCGFMKLRDGRYEANCAPDWIKWIRVLSDA